jgi:predicted nucleic acid-binding protein
MNFLLDTNVVSEWVKARPDPGVAAWLADADEDRTFISVITLAELHYGVERMAAGKRRSRLELWLREELPVRFEERILPIDPAIASAWGVAVARCESLGAPPGIMDSFLAATALVHRMTLVTRNVGDFEALGTRFVNPWSG